MANIYIVYGRSGEHSDFAEWDAKAFLAQEKAIHYMQILNATLEKYGAHKTCTNRVQSNTEMFNEMMELDHRFQIDYTGTNYRMRPLELVD